MPMPTVSQAAAAAACAVFVAAASWLALSDFPVPDPGRPTTKAPELQLLEAAVPAIGDFASFNVNKWNPFIPYDLRIHEIPLIDQPKPSAKPPNSRPGPILPEKPQLPRLAAPGQTGPTVTGIVISKDGAQVLLTFPGDVRGQLLKPGETANGWTLITVIAGNIARVRQDATGSILDLVIAETPNLPLAEDPAQHERGDQRFQDTAAENRINPRQNPEKGQQAIPDPSPEPGLELPFMPVEATPASPPAPERARARPDKVM